MNDRKTNKQWKEGKEIKKVIKQNRECGPISCPPTQNGNKQTEQRLWANQLS
jgi:hypothetical protein